MLKTPTAKMPGGTPTADLHFGDKRYVQGAWPKLSRVMRRLNPVCQRILNVGSYRNEQCHNAAALVHHLIAPQERPELFLQPTNLVALCFSCHPDTPGTPNWVVGKDYVETELPKWRI
jgi:5-methylcytosine-specific restriction endonuclease McrA